QQEPVRLVVPALGRLEVTLVDHAGAPLLSPAMVFCGADGERESDDFPIGWGTGRRADKPAGAAPVVLEPVAVGDALVAYARYPDERRITSAPPRRGPERPGELVEVRVPPRDVHVVLAGRVLGPDQQPLAEPPGGNRARLVIWNGERVERVFDVHAIADGRFDLVTSGHDGDGPFRAELRVAARDDNGAAVGQLGCALPMPKWPGGVRVELGTFVVQPLPPLAAGVVVDDRGQPVAGAQVTVQQLVGTAPSQQPPGNDGRRVQPPRRGLPLNEEGWPQRRAEPQERWSDLPGLRTRSADDGTFALFGDLPPGRLRVRADTDRHFADSVPLAAADRTMQIRIARNGIVRGRVRLPDWLADGAVAVTLRPLDEAARQRDTRRADVSRRGGRFTLEPLQPGRYDFLVTMRGWREPLLLVPDVFVQPGENDDARLREIDLREALFRYRLRAVDESAQLLPLDGPIRARLQQPDGTWTEAGFRWRGGRAELITAASLLTVQVFGRGIETLETQLLPGDHDLRLRTLRPALLDVPGARALCGPTRKVRLSVILQGDTGLPSSFQGVDQRTGEPFSLPRWDLGRSSGGWLEASDLVEVPLMVAGKYEVLLRPHATDTTNSPQASIPLGSYELRPGGDAVTTIHVDALAVTEALQRLDEQQRQRGAQEPRGGPRRSGR
ncbi:MAG: hypothetical protein H6835_20195, partial [Planctomycetes bacterium]|nr:hypothetical protein [Planctomycetota bacterium]